MHTTIMKDENGNEIVIPRSHKSMADVRRRIAEEKIKAFNLNCTPEEYWKRCEEKKNNASPDSL